MKVTLLICALVIVMLVGFLAWASWPWSLAEDRQSLEIIEFNDVITDGEESPSVIKILTWNLGFLYGDGSEGPGYVFRDESFYQKKLDQLVEQLTEWDVDIICLQEVDFYSQRSGYLNQARILAKKTGFPFVAEAPSWVANYIPFPYWPLKNHFGFMKSGGAILSKYPITSHEVVQFSKPTAHPWWYNLFYLHRYSQRVSIDVGREKPLVISNVHLEAFDKAERSIQIKTIMNADAQSDLIAGDFNMIPDIASKKRNFKNGDDYENDISFSLTKISKYLEVIPENIYSENEQIYFTFPASSPDRRLDYIFYERGHKMMKAEVLSSQISDHFPLRASFQLGTPKFNPFQ